MSYMPTFLVIGAARSGTTAFYTYLRQHPDVFMSVYKEPNFFAFENHALDFAGPGADYVNNSVNTLADYQELFASASQERARGEASPLYLYSEQAPQCIRSHVPDIKLIAILRNPIEQAFSHFLYAKRQVLEPLGDFTSALRAETTRARNHWMPMFQYSRFPRYHEQLQRYYAEFPMSQLRVFLYEDFLENPQAVLSETFSFIGVDPDFVADQTYRPNAGGIPKNSLLQNILMKPHAVTKLAGYLLPDEFKRRIRDAISDRNLEKPEIPKEAREFLQAELKDDIFQLQDLLGRNLASWLE